MKQSLDYRKAIPDSRRIIIKIGSRVLVDETGRPDEDRIQHLCEEVAYLISEDYEVALVSSGAVSAGMEALGMRDRPQTVSELQMAAAVGQPRLIAHYQECFAEFGILVGQVLLTRDDFHHKNRLHNAEHTLKQLFENGVLPIINENDVVADEEMKEVATFGDNDQLASLVVDLIGADLLIMLSTVDGVLEFHEDGTSTRIKYIEKINRKVLSHVTEEKSVLSKGGMSSKLKAAKTVVETGAIAVIADGRSQNVLSRIIAGEDTGTVILPDSLK